MVGSQEKNLLRQMTQDKQVMDKRTAHDNQMGEDTTRGGGQRTQRKVVGRQMIQHERGTDNVGG